MKKRTWIAFLAALLLTGNLCGSALAAGDESYTVRVYAGAQGSIDGASYVDISCAYGDEFVFVAQDRVSLPEGSKYYVRGIRESGKDNATVNLPRSVVTHDVDYVVAYGIRGNEVQYTVSYVDAAGSALAPSVTYTGNEGDKPVVAYRYIEGYVPRYYNITGTLQGGETNQFTFVYDRAPTPTVEQPQTPAQQPQAPQNSEGEQNPPVQQPEQPQADVEEAFPETEEILDMDTPLAGPGFGDHTPQTGGVSINSELVHILGEVVVGITAGALGIGASYGLLSVIARWIKAIFFTRGKH